MNPTNLEQTQRRCIVDEALRWLRTPYRNCANVLGVGVDCAMLLVEVYKTVGKLPSDYDPRPYAPSWFLHRSEERYLAPLGVFGRRIDVGEVQAGDIAVYRFGRTASHGAIVVDQDYIIHANRVAGCVELLERSAMVTRLDSYWSIF